MLRPPWSDAFWLWCHGMNIPCNVLWTHKWHHFTQGHSNPGGNFFCLTKTRGSTAERAHPKEPHKHLWSCQCPEAQRGSASAGGLVDAGCTGAHWEVTRSRRCVNTGLRLCFPALQVLAGGLASRKTPSARSSLWIWALWTFRRGTMNASFCEMGSTGW